MLLSLPSIGLAVVVLAATVLEVRPASQSTITKAAGGVQNEKFKKVDHQADRRAREARQRARRIEDIRDRRIPERRWYHPDDDDDLYDHGMGIDDDDDYYYERHKRDKERSRHGRDYHKDYFDRDEYYDRRYSRRDRDGDEEGEKGPSEREIKRTIKRHAQDRLELFSKRRDIEDEKASERSKRAAELQEIDKKLRDLDATARAYAEKHSDRIGTTSTTTMPPRRQPFVPTGDPEADLKRRRKERDKRFKERKKRRDAREKKNAEKGRGPRGRGRRPDEYDEGEGREDQVDRELDSVMTQVEKLIKRAKAANYTAEGMEVIMQHISLYKEDELDRVDDMGAMEADILWENKEVDEDGHPLQLSQSEKDARRDRQKARRDEHRAWEDRLKKRRGEIADLIEDQEHIKDPPPHLSGRDCFKKCKEKSGPCAWCGEGNLCCRKNSHKDPEECKILHKLQRWIGKHTCVRPQDLNATEVPEDEVIESDDEEEEEEEEEDEEAEEEKVEKQPSRSEKKEEEKEEEEAEEEEVPRPYREVPEDDDDEEEGEEDEEGGEGDDEEEEDSAADL